MKVQDVISRVRNISGDINVLQFTDSQVLDWINDGIRECAIENNLLQKRASMPSAVGTSDYQLPPDILKLHSVKYNNEKIKVLTLEEFDNIYTNAESVGASEPSTSYVWAGKLTLFPTPATKNIITIDYIYDPPLHVVQELNVEIALPVGYHMRIVDYCLAQVAQQDDDLQRYNSKMLEFKTGVQNLKDQPETTYDLYPSISVSPRDSGGW